MVYVFVLILCIYYFLKDGYYNTSHTRGYNEFQNKLNKKDIM